jgi:rhomboid protease GluP
MGLIGLAAGWGHKDGTRTGIAIRNFMAQWGLYTIVFGFLVRADNAAHASGFACGFLLGLLARPQWDQRRSRALDGVMTFIGVVLAAGTAFLVFFPPG